MIFTICTLVSHLIFFISTFVFLFFYFTLFCLIYFTDLETNPLEPVNFENLRKSCLETKIASEKAIEKIRELNLEFGFNGNGITEIKNTEIVGKVNGGVKSEKIEKIEKQEGKEEKKEKEVVSGKIQRTIIIPHTPPMEADALPVAEHSLQKNDFLNFKEHSEILFAFSSVLVKVKQPSAIRTIHLKSFSVSTGHVLKMCEEVRTVHLFILYLFVFLFICIYSYLYLFAFLFVFVCLLDIISFVCFLFFGLFVS